MQFNHFGLKRLIATGYTTGNGALTNQVDLVDLMQNAGQSQEYENNTKKSYYIDISSVSPKLSNHFTENSEKELSNFDLLKILKKEGFIKEIRGNGDFRSDECIDLLKQSDIVITNPPFSLFREYVEQLMKYDKKFLIIGNKNSITYKEIFKFIKDDKMWLGFNSPNSFGMPDGTITNRMNGLTRWFTNLPISKRNEELILYKTYKGNEKDYPKYDNYDAIEVGKVADIPMDYYGVMGVPITFLDKYNPKQFEVVKFRKGDDDKDLTYAEIGGGGERFSHTSEYSFAIVGLDRYAEGNSMPGKRMCINGKEQYVRILIKRI